VFRSYYAGSVLHGYCTTPKCRLLATVLLHWLLAKQALHWAAFRNYYADSALRRVLQVVY